MSKSEKWNPESGESLADYKKRMGVVSGTVDPKAIDKMREDLEEKTLEAEEHKAKLHLLAEARFNEKKEVILERVSRVIKDEGRRKELLEKLEDSELPMEKRIQLLQSTEFALDTIENVKPKNREPTSKPSGTVPLSSQYGDSQDEDDFNQGFESEEAMIEFLVRKANDSPKGSTERKKANLVLEAMLAKALKTKPEHAKPFSIEADYGVDEFGKPIGILQKMKEEYRKKEQKKREDNPEYYERKRRQRRD